MRDVRKTYGDRVVLDGVDLTVEPHDVVCLIGASGAASRRCCVASTCSRTTDDGMIWFQGGEVSDPRVDPREVRKRIGMVFQAYNLFPHLTVLDN